jgi:hypothetical protein
MDARKSLISLTPVQLSQATNQGVVGSNPASGTNKIKDLRKKWRESFFRAHRVMPPFHREYVCFVATIAWAKRGCAALRPDGSLLAAAPGNLLA